MEAKQKDLKQRAFRLLARREYSRGELAQLLGEHVESVSQLNELLEWLAAENYQSDARFAESFIRARISQGKGLVRIRNELQQRGVANLLIDEKLTVAEVDWFALARQQRVKKFGDGVISDAKLKAKSMRFLLYRGFTQEQCRYAIEEVE